MGTPLTAAGPVTSKKAFNCPDALAADSPLALALVVTDNGDRLVPAAAVPDPGPNGENKGGWSVGGFVNVAVNGPQVNLCNC